ncbi:MAG TPA: hypothetical protein VGL72_07180 [Bryobacteraceae bacterium]
MIDYPGASSTLAWGINSRGDIVGYYTGADNNSHGFLLNGGHYAAIDYPGAAVTLVEGINPQGDVVGEFGVTASSPHRAFQLGADGVYTAFDFPGATTTSFAGINGRGEIAGQYTLADGNRHTFLMAGGRLTKIDYPAATATGPLGITPQGEVVGAYVVNGVAHGYVYSTGSGFTTIDYPASTYTNVTGRNSSGDIVGRYLDSASVSHGYILSNGQFTTIDYPGASFTGLSAIDPAGNVVGRCTVNGVNRGFLLPSTPPALRYSLTDLGLVGKPPGQPITITDNGLIAGVATTETGVAHAVVWSVRGVMTDLGSPGLNSTAFGINDSGVAVGQAEIADKDPGGEDFCGSKGLGLPATGATCVPFAAQHGTMQALRTLGGTNGAASFINARGQIVGVAEKNTVDPACPSPQKYQFKPVLWEGGLVNELPTIGSDLNGYANGINENGDIVGGSGNCAEFNPNLGQHMRSLHAVLWEAGRVIDLGNLGGTGQVLGHYAHSINNNREVIGYSDVAGDRAVHAFRWTRVSGMQDLGTLEGDGHSLGIGLNDAGVITGISASADFSSIRAFVWRDGAMMDLNQLIPATSALYLLTACSVNARGEIIGFAVDHEGNLHGYLAAPDQAGEGDSAVGYNSRQLSAAARNRMRVVGLGLVGRRADR